MSSLRLIMYFLHLIIFICIPSKILHAQDKSISIGEAKTAFNRFDLKKSMAIYSAISTSKNMNIKDKVEALQNIAMQWWTFFLDYKKSSNNLKLALEFNIDRSKTYLLYSQINLESFKFQEAYQFIDSAMALSYSESDKVNAALLNAQIIYNESNYLIQKGITPDRRKLLIASALLKNILQKQPGNPISAELLVGISLINKNGKDLLRAWKAYYFITEEEKINHILKPSYKSLLSILPSWNERELTIEERIILTKALAASNFYNFSSLLATSKIFGKLIPSRLLITSGINKILQFNEFIEGVKKINDTFYPKIGQGIKGYDSSYAKTITNVAKKLWMQLDEQNTTSNYKEELFFELIKEQYGALGYIGTTNGYFSMLLGLIIHDEIKEVNQYGYKAKFRYISISRLISKDFTSWQGTANVGGWGTDSSMVQVRDAYLQAPFTRLGWVTDSTAHAGIVKQIETAKAIDIVNCQKDKYAEPTYLMPSLRLKASEYLYESLKKAGLSDEALAITFVAEILRLNIESTIFGHEGRHAIDQLFFKKEFDTWTDDERELRAKYSEIIFSANPKLAHTGSFLGGDLDTTTAHGKANFRLRKIFVTWMEAHADEIKNIDKKLPLIMQINLLTDEQVTNISIEADPLSNK
jgi:hypothetical protein